MPCKQGRRVRGLGRALGIVMPIENGGGRVILAARLGLLCLLKLAACVEQGRLARGLGRALGQRNGG